MVGGHGPFRGLDAPLALGVFYHNENGENNNTLDQNRYLRNTDNLFAMLLRHFSVASS